MNVWCKGSTSHAASHDIHSWTGLAVVPKAACDVLPVAMTGKHFASAHLL